MNYKQLQLPLMSMQLINALNGEEIISSIRKKSFDRSSIIPLTFARVLVVDDNATNLQVAEGLMTPYRMKIDTATSGFKAIELVKAIHYDAIFMDHMMPEMDGIEATQYIRNLPGEYYKKIPIIALTANAMTDARQMFLDAGMNDFVAKPIEMTELNRVLKKYVQVNAPEGYLRKMISQQSGKRKQPLGSPADISGPVNREIPAGITGSSAGSAPVYRTGSLAGSFAGSPVGSFAASPVMYQSGPALGETTGNALSGLIWQNNQLLSQNTLLLTNLLHALGGTEPNTGSDDYEYSENGYDLDATAADAPAFTGPGTFNGSAASGWPNNPRQTGPFKNADAGVDAVPAGNTEDYAGTEDEDYVPLDLRDHISGVDMQKSLETYGSVAIYHNILKTYYEDLSQKEPELQELYDDRDGEALTICVHAIKSASRGAGANELADMAYELEKAGNDEDWVFIESKFPDFMNAVHRMVHNVGNYVKKYLTEKPAETLEESDAFDPQILDRIRAASAEMDYMKVEELLHELGKSQYPPKQTDMLIKMFDACSSFDYDKLDSLIQDL